MVLRTEQRLGRNEITKALNGEVSAVTVGRWLRDYPLTTKEQDIVYRRGRANQRVVSRRKPRPICLNCDKEISKTARKYCSVKCRVDFDYQSFVRRWMAGEESGGQPSRPDDLVGAVRRWLGEQKGKACWDCGWAKVNPASNKVPVQVDHIDGEPENHRPENLRLLCPSCHSLTPTYMALNKGNGRKSRYKKRNTGT